MDAVSFSGKPMLTASKNLFYNDFNNYHTSLAEARKVTVK